MPHLAYTLLTAILLSMALSMLENRTGRERLYVAARVFFCCVITTLGGSWLMRLIHG